MNGELLKIDAVFYAAAIAQRDRYAKKLGLLKSELAKAQAQLEQKDAALTLLAEHFRVPLAPHDPSEWHGNMAENIASCPTCVINKALSLPVGGPLRRPAE